ncbi:DNA/RNA helicase domain-containing protein [Vibrio splendidus]|uniref:DNA/RNA helicase domain-containing protein n=1 Tax=Vibrio splendidus TaxID=29497 RepID=UPI000E09454E|nr:DNA/RNA helicase domain-containing protein [Vibrio splendidus]
MKDINILSLVQAFNSLEGEAFRRFVDFHDIDIKDAEIEDLKQLVESICGTLQQPSFLSQFYVGYKIPQIGKEFDLLKVGEDYVLNIELKRESTVEKIEKQLKRNKYYLSYLRECVHNFTYVSSTGEVYLLDDDENLALSDIQTLIGILTPMVVSKISNLDHEFNPSNYLVSPFNSTEKFVADKYFLTNQQEDIKKNILRELGNVDAKFISLVGSAGTGKTLLAYDIVKEYKQTKNPLIVHCGYLNEGHQTLIRDGWDIVPIRDLRRRDVADYDAVFIDEAQRIYENQLNNTIEGIRSSNGKIVFCYDQLQTLSDSEARRDIDEKINNIDGIIRYQLSEKIRTNKEIATFIKCLFDKSRNLPIHHSHNIDFVYFDNADDAKSKIRSLSGDDWEVIRFTPSQYHNEHHEQYSNTTCQTSHGIIGQEFDNVAIVLDNLFYYSDSNVLDYRGRVYYNPIKMLFQNITRTRKKLKIVIINNQDLLERCMSILN